MAEQPSLAGPLGRINRANELLRELDAAMNAFLQARPYTVTLQDDPNPANRRFLVTHVQDVPMRLSIMGGEVAHHLRASLDLLVYQLLIKERVTDAKRLSECAFPIIVSRDLAKPDDKKRHDDAIWKRIGGVASKAHDRIVALQPCAANREWSHLAQVQELDNTDKHRLLLAAASSTRLENFAYHAENGTVQVFPEAFVPLQEDAVFLFNHFRPGWQPPNLARVVAFMEPGPVFGKPVVHILQNLANMTHETLEGFADCFERKRSCSLS